MEDVKTGRKADYPIEPLLLERWSPRAMSGEPISQQQLMQLFEAARWAASSFNNQPWRFVYAIRDSHYWQQFLSFILPGNRVWSEKAAVLIVVLSHHEESNSVHLTTGCALQNMLLEASALHLVAHGIAGIDHEKIKKELQLSDDYTVECMVVIGTPGNIKDLPEKLQAREIPSSRKKIEEFVFEGKLTENK
ncbi:MAG: nitroreductase family protein [Candidatus Babeliaceae bacterium]